MPDILIAAAQKVTAIVIIPIAAVFGTIFHFQNESIGQAPLQIPQIQVFSVPNSDGIIVLNRTEATLSASSTKKFSLPEVKLKKTAVVPETKSVQKTEVAKLKTATQPQAVTPKPAVAKISTPQEALNATSFSLNQRVDGQYVMTLHMNTNSGSGLDWELYEETIGGTQSLPKMNVSYSCTPQWNPPPANSPDLNPTFDLNTSYSCDISMTDPLLRTATKKIDFKTDVGRLLIKSSSLSTSLKSGTNTNGFVFDNQSDAKLTITGATFDVYYKALNVSSPIVVRFINPDDETSFIDFPAQNLPVSAANPDARSATGLKTSFSFSINPRSQRLLEVNLLGVQQLLTTGFNPEFKIILREINTDNPDFKTIFYSPTILWSCIPFNPATSLDGIPNEQNCR